MTEGSAERAGFVVGGGGLGAAVARELLARGFGTVFVSSRDPAARPELRDLARAHEGRVRLCALDVTDEASIARAVDGLVEQTSRLHAVFGCSGVLHDETRGLGPEKRLEDLDPERLARSFAVNASGPLLVVKHLLPLLRHEERSVIALVSAKVGSIGDNGLGGWYAYRASKAALNMLTRTLALELKRRAPQAVCVALHPGTVDTALSKPFQRGVDPDVLVTPDEAARRLLRVVDGLGPDQSGGFFSWDGSSLPW